MEKLEEEKKYASGDGESGDATNEHIEGGSQDQKLK